MHTSIHFFSTHIHTHSLIIYLKVHFYSCSNICSFESNKHLCHGKCLLCVWLEIFFPRPQKIFPFEVFRCFCFFDHEKGFSLLFPFWTFPSQLINRCHLHSGFSHLFLSISCLFFCPSLSIYFYLSPSFLFPLTSSFYFSHFLHASIFLHLSFALHCCSF